MSNSRKGPPDTAAGKDEQQTPASQAGGAGDSPEKPKAEAAGSEKGKEQGQDKAADGARTEADDAARQKPQAGKSSAEKASAARTGVENADAAPAAQAAGEAAQTPRRSGWGRMVTNILLALILLVLLIAGTIYVAWPSLPAGLRTALSPARLLSTDTLDAAQARIDALEVRIAELEAKTAQPAAPVTGVAPQTLSALDERMAKLEGILSTLEQSVGSDRTVSNLQGRLDGLSDRTQAMSETLARIERDGATADDIAALRERVQGAAERIDALDKRVNSIDDIAANIADRTRLLERQMAETPTSDGMRLSALVLSAGQLKTAIQSGRSFVGELAAIKALGGDEPLVAEALAPLDSHAAAGVPTVEMLAERFSELAPRLIRGKPASGDWLDQTMESVRGLVTVRRVRPESESLADGKADSDAIVAAIEQRLAAEDLAGAIAQLERLDEATRALAADWRNDAQARLKADDALARLDAALIERLKETGSAARARTRAQGQPAAGVGAGEEGGS